MNAAVQPAVSSFIDGVLASHGTGGFSLVRPQDGAVIGRIEEAGSSGVEAAVGCCRVAFARTRRQPLRQRIVWLQAATTLHAWAVQRAEGLVMGATPGGVNQLPWNLQSVVELLAGAALKDVVCSPRWALNEQDVLSVEEGATIRPGGVPHQQTAPFSQRSAQQVLAIPRHGQIGAAADPRVAASAMAAY